MHEFYFRVEMPWSWFPSIRIQEWLNIERKKKIVHDGTKAQMHEWRKKRLVGAGASIEPNEEITEGTHHQPLRARVRTMIVARIVYNSRMKTSTAKQA